MWWLLPDTETFQSLRRQYSEYHIHVNTALFSRLGPSSTLIRHENGTLRKDSSNRRKFKTPAFRFLVDGKHFENGAFRKRWRHDNHVISLTEFSSNTNPKWSVIVASLNSSGVVWTENIWCVFGVKPPFSNSSGVYSVPQAKHINSIAACLLSILTKNVC